MRPISFRVALLLVLPAWASLVGASIAAAGTCPGQIGPQCPYDAVQLLGEGRPGELQAPLSASVGPGGSIFVADASEGGGRAGRVDVYDRSGGFVRELVPSADPVTFTDPYRTYQPADVAVGPDGSALVLARTGEILWRFDGSGRYLGSVPIPGGGAQLVAAAADGTFWVLYAGGLVEHRSSDATVMTSFMSRATPVSWALGVAPGGDVLTGDPDGIAEYHPDGSLVHTFGAPARGHIAVTAGGDIIAVLGDGITRVPAGAPLSPQEVDRPGSGPGQFSNLTGVSVASAGALAGGRPGEESLVVVDAGNHRVQLLAADDSPLAVIGTPRESALASPGSAWGIPDGSLLVADSGNHRVVRYGTDGTFLGRADAGVDGFPFTGVYNAAAGESDVLEADPSYYVTRLAPDGRRIGRWTIPSAGSQQTVPTDLAAGADGTVYVALSGVFPGGAVLRYAADGTALGTVGPSTGPGVIDQPASVATAPDGTLIVGNHAGTSIDMYAAAGTYRGTLGDPDCIPARHLAVDAADRIYLASDANVVIIDRTGSILGRFGQPGAGPGQFDGISTLNVAGSTLTITDTRVTRLHLDATTLHHPTSPTCSTGGPPTTPTGTAAPASTTLPVTGSKAKLTLRCQGVAAARCIGTATLLSTRADLRHLRRRDILASSPFSVTTGTRKRVFLTLKAHERHSLQRRHHLRVRLVIAPPHAAPKIRMVTLKTTAARHHA